MSEQIKIPFKTSAADTRVCLCDVSFDDSSNVIISFNSTFCLQPKYLEPAPHRNMTNMMSIVKRNEYSVVFHSLVTATWQLLLWFESKD